MKKIFQDVDLESLVPLINDLAIKDNINLTIDNYFGFCIQVAIMSYLRGMDVAAKEIFGKNYEGAEFIIKQEEESDVC